MTSTTFARAGIATAATMGLFIVALRLGDAGPPGDPPLAALAFAAVYLAPTALGAIGHRRGDGATLAAAALLCGLASVTAFSLVTVPFLIPAVLLVAAAGRASWRRLGGLIAAAEALIVVAAFYAVVTLREWQCVSGPNYQACGDDPTTTGGLLALVLVGLALVIALVATRTARLSPARPIIAGDGDPEDPRPPGQ
ncbi:MAG: hypothetical protein ACHQ15_07805 [Candidatus Limnocylindrales bacterium]